MTTSHTPPARVFNPSPAQQAYFTWLRTGHGSAVLEAVAGAGKSTTLVRGMEHAQGTKTCLVFNNKMAKELREKAEGVMDPRDIKTFHAAGYSALRRAFPNAGFARPGVEPDGKKVLRIVEARIKGLDRPDLVGLESAVADVVSMAKQRGIGALCPIGNTQQWMDMVEHFALDDALPEGKEEMIPQLVKLAQLALRDSNEDLETIDFDDMVYLALQRNVRFFRTDWVFIDEAQDTNPTRRALAGRMLRPGGRMVAVGDPHQAIYGFTGTDNDSLEQIAAEYRAIRLPLTVTYRCPKAVVAEARKYVHHIEAHETAPEGEVIRYHYSEVADRVQLGDAVLCRYNKYLVSLCFRLIKSGVAAKIEGRSIGEGLVKLAGRWKRARTLNALEGNLETYLERELAKAEAKANEQRAEEARDRHETMGVLIARARELGYDQVSQLQELIRGMFADDVSSSRVVTLCSEHRAKGLEWHRVHILGLEEIQPGRARHEWQLAQEYNLMYVALTRAMTTLHIVSGIREEK